MSFQGWDEHIKNDMFVSYSVSLEKTCCVRQMELQVSRLRGRDRTTIRRLGYEGQEISKQDYFRNNGVYHGGKYADGDTDQDACG